MYAEELTFSVADIRGIGKVTAKTLSRAGIYTIADLLRTIPRNYENRKERVPLSSVPEIKTVNTVVTVQAHSFIGYGKKRTLKIHLSDGTAEGILLCFGRNFLQKKLAVGKQFFLYGTFSYKYGERQSSQFEIEEFSSRPKNFNKILPVYPLWGNLKQGTMRKIMAYVISAYSDTVENQLPETLMKKYKFPSRSEAVRTVHFPDSMKNLERAINLLKYEELFYLQLIIARRSLNYKQNTRSIRKIPETMRKTLEETLPFTLTRDQKKVLEEIQKDMESEKPMYRLLQGDVGCGKTLVAFIAALGIIEQGGQVAFMAPTELLARQHAKTATKLLSLPGVHIAFLSGNTPAKQRQELLETLARGEINFLIGTHALFTRDVIFKNLQFVIVDEQHKFGVLQRLALLDKGSTPDLLLMTATPIPRTLTMTVFADLDVSIMRTMPKGRKPVITHLSKMSNREKVFEAVRSELQKGHQAYFIYPRIEQTDRSTAKQLHDAESMFTYLQKTVYREFTVALLHSRISENKKESIMEEFSRGTIDVLVATSVVEVGVDVKNATCMVIEHAEQFGLSGLHQLRGRVGRGEAQAYAFLIYSDQLSETGKERLKVMMKCSDGFSLSEEDLRIRGPGELAGQQQSGFLKLTFADILQDGKICVTARRDARALLAADPGFIDSSHRMIREVFERCPPFKDKLLSSG